MKKLLLAVAVLAIAAIAMPAHSAPAGGVSIAIEHTAKMPAAALQTVPTVQPVDQLLAGRGGLDVVAPAIPAAVMPWSTPWSVAAAVLVSDRDPIAYHMRL